MSKLKTIARRTFLIGTAAIAGGVAFGTYVYNKPGENPLMDGLGEGEAALTPYVKIDADGITLITPRADVGQGAFSMQATLIAEELDVELDQIKIDPGVPSATYYNTALSAESAPFSATDDGFMAQSTRTVMDAFMKFLGVQVTGGSSSVPDSYEKLRIAGAVARETLKKAAAQESGISINELKTVNGHVELPDGKKISYIDLAAIAATIEPARDITLRDPSKWRLIGKDIMRHDVRAKSTGTLTYGIDMVIDGMLYATAITNPRKGAGMKSYNASEAEQMRGVKQIVALTNGVGVIADNTWRAIKAANAIEFEWEEAAYPAEMDGHWKILSDSFNEDHVDSRMRDEGNIDTGLAEGNLVEAEYRAPYLVHAPLEPLAVTVQITDKRIDVWLSTQVPGFLKSMLKDITELGEDQVHIHNMYGGGSFGHRLEMDVVKHAVEIAKSVKGKPVKFTYSREEDMAQDFTRQIAISRMKGSHKNGKVETLDLGIAMPSVVNSQMGRIGLPAPGPDLQIIAGAWEQPYSIPNYRVTGYRAPEIAPISSWRSVGASTNGFFHDCALDEIIHAAGADPLEERIRLMRHENSRKTLEAVGEMSSWDGKLEPNKARGVAFCLSFGVPTAEVVEISMTDDGIKLDKVFVACEVGKVIDPINFDNQVKGAAIWGLGHAIHNETTFSDGMVEQVNYDTFESMRMYQTPEIIVRGLENGEAVRGAGEPAVPPAAPALANAIFALTGKRLREMPFGKHVDFI